MSVHKIQRSIFWDDAQYLVEDLDGDFAVTRITEDGAGLYVSLNEATAVTAHLNSQGTGEIGRVA